MKSKMRLEDIMDVAGSIVLALCMAACAIGYIAWVIVGIFTGEWKTAYIDISRVGFVIPVIISSIVEKDYKFVMDAARIYLIFYILFPGI